MSSVARFSTGGVVVVVSSDKVQESKTFVGWICHDDSELMNLVRVDTRFSCDRVSTAAAVSGAINVDVGIENVHPVDIGGKRMCGDSTTELVLKIRVGQVSERIEGGTSIIVVRCFIETTSVTEGESPVVNDTIEGGLKLVGFGTVYIGVEITFVDMMTVMIFRITIIILITPSLWVDGIHDMIGISYINVVAGSNLVTVVGVGAGDVVKITSGVGVFEAILMVVMVIFLIGSRVSNQVVVSVMEFTIKTHITHGVRVPA